ncbi:hypothetical protein ALC53_09462 [Atta colombica]|uniref:Uncharacterized protein n=1 Tax=Atta colombica TaxID=520822 RepID=A0A195B772_9HYME|nr:hypothetical protein ALC53_09462 [Atta colombica]
MSDKSESVRNRDPCSGRETSLQDAAGMRPRQDRYLRTKDVRTGPGLGFAGDLAESEMRSNSRQIIFPRKTGRRLECMGLYFYVKPNNVFFALYLYCKNSFIGKHGTRNICKMIRDVPCSALMNKN